MEAKVLVLGGLGMLGSAVVHRLEKSEAAVTGTVRDISRAIGKHAHFKPFSVGDTGLAALLEDYGEGDYVVNCIGLIKHRMDDSNESHRFDAVRVNAAFPYVLAGFAERQGFRIIQIATDCVYSGSRGSYDEESLHDAHDVYGKSKSLGEVPSPQVLNLRCSIIGREESGAISLVGWLLSQDTGSTIHGYTDHLWNGITTDCFADITAGLVSSENELSGTFHLVPADVMNKSELSSTVLRTFGRKDVTVIPTVTSENVNRTLSTLHPETNRMLWRLGGFSAPLKIEEMVGRLAQ